MFICFTICPEFRLCVGVMVSRSKQHTRRNSWNLPVLSFSWTQRTERAMVRTPQRKIAAAASTVQQRSISVRLRHHVGFLQYKKKKKHQYTSSYPPISRPTVALTTKFHPTKIISCYGFHLVHCCSAHERLNCKIILTLKK